MNPAMAALVQMQPLFNRPWPTVMLEVGNSQSVSDIKSIRDCALGHLTQVNVFVAVAYNRNHDRQSDSWYACVATRDINAIPPTPNSPNTYPPCIMVGELLKINNRYPKVDTPLPANNRVWTVATALLFYPEPVPVLVPPLPPTLDVDMERIRTTIARTRPP